ncbi:Uncharacterized conserved protein YbjT, contains NAD(P)-binding and DUF2867 domains [Mucilaginibacter gossypiicola]|uniref:Uncharacterized conserved protein YbjT, contains NAD(P)-binding and DUF2867 domains n=1 Tax=Mucilaginibacter gossypiicola TaxID=551995 RepID=A0A1H8D764_9SPHI|nr:NmrA family NAD(P)-binding protein [Mucilaginibacter gossypiicola]SEN03151.1 Uncharacterized conserved protein YbjT, contains NAD(P)-binding and DUF2867 domains [Mucilaginibacter gossypiicola]
MKNNILLFNGSGTISKLTAENLIRQNVFFSTTSRGNVNLFPGIPNFQVDLQTGEGLPAALANIDAILLVTPDNDEQAKMELRIVDEAVKAGVKNIVKISSMNADKGKYLLGNIHYGIEEYIKLSGVNWTFLRPSVFMQNFTTYYLKDIRSRQLLRLPCGHAPINFIDAKDIANVAALALTSTLFENQSFDIFGPDALSYEDAIAIISAEIGIPLKYEAISNEEYKTIIGEGVTYDRIVDLYNYYRNGYAVGRSDNLIHSTGEPFRSFKSFIKEYRDYFCN